MRKLRILLLVDEDLVPPANHAEDYTTEPWKTENDVLLTLRGLGHDVRVLGVDRNLEAIQELHRQWKPHVAFALLEDVYTVIPYDHNMISYLELLGMAYTGCNPLGLLISRDKGLTKKLLSYHRLHVPKFIVCRRGQRVRRPRRLEFPLIVKSLTEHGSSGISRRSIVHDDAALGERVAFIHDKIETDAIVEQFIDGREFYVGILGNHRLEVFEPWELIVEGLGDDQPLLATRRLKWRLSYQKKLRVRTQRAEDLSDELRAHIDRMSRRVYRRLHLSGYARLDFRLAADGTPYLLEPNANPQLAFGEDFAEAAEHAGIHYPQLVQRIVNLGLRWRDEHALA